MLKLIDVEQSTSKWHSWRKGKIGSSTAPAILNCKDSYQTPIEAFYELLGLSTRQETPAMTRGKDLEQQARLAFEEWHGGIFTPACVEHPEYPELIASLDGLSLDNEEILEIKCCKKEIFDLVKKGGIPDNYRAQIQHQLMCTGLKKAWLWCWNGESGVSLEIQRDEEFIQDLLIKEREFLELLRRKEPPPLTQKDIILREDREWINLSKQYLDVCKQLTDLEDQKLLLRASMIKISQGKNCQGGGIRLRHGFQKGRVDYPLMCSTSGLNQEEYRKEPTKIITITEIKNEKTFSDFGLD